MMGDDNRVALFDAWADDYDHDLQFPNTFSFDGYSRILDCAVAAADVQPGMRVLDVGVGTGNLAARFIAAGAVVWGTDFSEAMLQKAHTNVPTLTVVNADIREPWPVQLPRQFDRVVSAYVLHEFDLLTKVHIVQQWMEHLSPNGRILIADIAFPTVAAREEARRRWASAWDNDEHYWAADEARAAYTEVGITLHYQQLSSCGGLFMMGMDG